MLPRGGVGCERYPSSSHKPRCLHSALPCPQQRWASVPRPPRGCEGSLKLAHPIYFIGKHGVGLLFLWKAKYFQFSDLHRHSPPPHWLESQPCLCKASSPGLSCSQLCPPPSMAGLWESLPGAWKDTAQAPGV